MSKLELLLEAERRGILPENKAALLTEARNRGLVAPLQNSNSNIPLEQRTEIPTQDNPQGVSSAPSGSKRQITDPHSLRGTINSFGDFVQDAGGQVLKNAVGLAETGANVITGALAQPLSGVGGIGNMLIGESAEDNARMVEQFQRDLTYQPKFFKDEAQDYQGAIGTLLEPVGAGLEVASEFAGEAAGGERNPAAAALLSATPQVALEALGLKAIPKGTTKNKLIPQEQSNLINTAKNEGIPLMTSDLKPPQTFAKKVLSESAEKIPFVGTGVARQAQQEARVAAVDRVLDKYAGFSYSDIVSSLKSKTEKAKQAAGSVLEATAQQLDGAGEMSLTNTKKAIDRAKQELTKKGVIQSGKASDDLSVLIEALEQPQTFTSLKENRTAFREIINSVDPAVRSQLTSRSKSMLQIVQRAMTDDMQTFAAQNLPKGDYIKWQQANKAWADEAQKLTKTRLKTILDKGEVTPEIVDNMLFSRKTSEIKLLYKNLGKSGKAHARSAIINRIVDTLSKRQSGVSPNSFASEMAKYSPHIKTFFKGDDFRQLKGLQKVLEATRRAQDSKLTTPTGQQLIPLITGAGLATETALTAGGAGTLAVLSRLYESRGVRNALLAVDSAPAGSARQMEAIQKAYLALTVAYDSSSADSRQTDTDKQPKQ